MSVSFIKIDFDKNKAQDLGESPHAKIRYSSQIQLLTKDPQPYLQIAKGSVSENYKAYIVKCDNDIEIEAGDHIRIWNRGDNIAIQFIYMPWDFGNTPVYLKIARGTGIGSQESSFYYSNKFLITRSGEEYTSRVDYLFEKGKTVGISSITKDLYASIRLQFYKNNSVNATDVESYYQITTSQTINQRVSVKNYTQWMLNLFDAWTAKKLASVLYGGFCYINQTRNYIIDGLEDLERENMSNIFEDIFVTDPDEKDKIRIIEIIIGDDFEIVPFLASSSQLASSSFLSSQLEISIPIP